MKQVVELRPNGTKRVKSIVEGKSLTRQEFKTECDLYAIVKRFSKTPEGLAALMEFKTFSDTVLNDVSALPDFHTLQSTIAQGKGVFMRLPAALRSRFANDASQFLDFVRDPKNRDEAVSLGLLKAAPKAAPDANSPVKGAEAPKSPAG